MCGFRDKMLDEYWVFNAGETHFSVNHDLGHTIAMKADAKVKYSDAVWGDTGMTMLVILGGGLRQRFKIRMITFQNARFLNSIQNVPENVTGLWYVSGPKRWIDTRVFEEWINEKCVMPSLPEGRKGSIFGQFVLPQ